MTPENVEQLTAVAETYCGAMGNSFSGLAGHGAFKATYRVIAKAGEIMALKIYLPGAVTERAGRELRALARLSETNHPSLPKFLAIESFTHQGNQYLLSTEEFLDGGSLTDYVTQNGLLSRKKLITIGRQLSSALSEVEAADLVHRDVKPDNIVLKAGGTAVLIDFGLVRNLAQQSLTQTWLAQGPGTPLYASPEQLNNDKQLIDWRTDQFGLAVALAMCSYGRHPYAASAGSPDSAVARVAERSGVSMEFVRWAKDHNLDPLIKMLDPWPVGRYRIPKDLEAAFSSL